MGQQGFTLIEQIVTVAIMAMVLVAGLAALSGKHQPPHPLPPGPWGLHNSVTEPGNDPGSGTAGVY